MIGCDLHDRSMLLRYAVDTGKPQQVSYDNDARGRQRMIRNLKSLAKEHQANRIVFAYEASGLGYGLSDLLHEHHIECHVLSPTHLPKTPKSAKQKTDARDAQMLLEQVRGFVLAGNSLPVVWTPPHRLRHDRELVRARVDVADEATRVKLKVTSMLKRHGITKPTWYTSRWSKRFVKWLREVAADLDRTVGAVLELLIDRHELYKQEQNNLDKAIKQLSQTDRYKAPSRKLCSITGVGILSAMTFLTEMGDLNRFRNRREVGAYLGLCPASYESGETNNRKGRITRQGPSRLRKMLCQSAWVSIIHCKKAAADYHRIKQKQSKRTKKALVAMMRKLGIKMWHVAQNCGVSVELAGRGGPHDVMPSGNAQPKGLVSFVR
jgi:transposase